MFLVILHDPMKDILSKEFVSFLGSTEKEAADGAWKLLRKEAGDSVDNLRYEGIECKARKLTKSKFTQAVIDNINDEDGLLISGLTYIYAKMIKVV